MLPELFYKYPLILPYTPRVIFLEPTNRCNLQCNICARNYWDHEKNKAGDAPLSLFRQYLPFLRKAREIRLHGHGEPMLGRNFFAFLSMSCKTGALVSFNTNGTLISMDNVPALINSGVNNINISAPDPSGDTQLSDSANTVAANGLNLDQALEKIRIIRIYRDKVGRSKPELFIASINTASARNTFKKRAEDMAEAGVKGIILQPLRAWKNGFQALAADNCIDIELKNALQNAGLSMAVTSSYQRKNGIIRPVCTEPWNTLAIKHDGTVHACCTAFFQNSKVGAEIGATGYFRSPWLIWNSPAMIKLRASLLSGMPPKGCRNCANPRAVRRIAHDPPSGHKATLPSLTGPPP